VTARYAHARMTYLHSSPNGSYKQSSLIPSSPSSSSKHASSLPALFAKLSKLPLLLQQHKPHLLSFSPQLRAPGIFLS